MGFVAHFNKEDTMRPGLVIGIIRLSCAWLAVSGAASAETITGLPGVAIQTSTIRVSDLARVPTVEPRLWRQETFQEMPLPVPRRTESPQVNDERGEPEGPSVYPLDIPSPAPAASFLALGDNNTAIPPDTIGAVGSNHVMTTLNTEVRIQNRSGSNLSTVSIDAFWASLGNPDVFDPKVAYEPYGQRFIFTALGNPRSASSSILVGVSAGSDPTGTWYLFKVDADASNILWADYPSLGFNRKWIVVQVNMYPISTGSFRSDVLVFDKADLYAGGTGKHKRIPLINYGGVQAPAVTYDNALDVLYLLQDYNGNSGGKGYLRLYTVTGNVGQESITVGDLISVSTPWGTQARSDGSDFAPQKGSSQKIQTNDSRLRNVLYRNGSLWAAQTVFLPPSAPARAAAQWWQVRPDGSVAQLGRVEDTTNALFYYFPTIGVNAVGDALLGYTMSSTQMYAGAAYSFRAASDPPGTMRQPYLYKAGEAPYYKTFGGNRNRWGDFSGTMVDPVNDLDFWTIQEYAALASAGVDRWGTWWAQVIPPVPVPPGAVTEPATSITAQSARLNGMVHPQGMTATAFFQWGLTTTYGNTTPVQSLPAGWTNVPVSAEIASLQSGRTYHFRMAASGPGGTTYGADRTFQTRFLMSHAAAALRVAGGLTRGTEIEVARMDVVKTGTSSGKVRIEDAVAIARNAAGLDP